MESLGFGVPGALVVEDIATVAAAAESAGFGSFWVNDTPGGDGLLGLQAASLVTSDIRLGVGVIPVDRKPADVIAKQISSLGLPEDRLVLGIGSGATRKGAIALVDEAIRELRRSTTAKIAVGALGPKMVALASREADAVLLNWLTTTQALHSVTSLRESGSKAGAIAYVRFGIEESRSNLKVEAARYNSYPQYHRHFLTMGVEAFDTCLIASDSTTVERLREFASVLDETVLRAVPVTEDANGYLQVMQAAINCLAFAR